MLHWASIILGGIFALFLVFYAYLVVCSLIENTGRPVFSVVIGGCHAAAPMVFLFFGWQCFLRVIPRYGLPLALLGAAVCLLLYLAQLAVTAGAVYGFLHL